MTHEYEESFRAAWDEQLKFTRRFWESQGGMPDHHDERVLTPIIKDYVLHLIKEATEVLDATKWRMHRKADGAINRGNALEEVIDSQKFVLGIAQVMGYTFDEYLDMFYRKSMVVEQRFTQEQNLAGLRDVPCALVDIDGVLADYPDYYYNWVYNEYNLSPTAYDSQDLLRKKEIKDAYRRSGAKTNIPLLPGARDLLLLLRAEGVKIVLITMRPYAEHYRIYPDTLLWLKKHDLPYDAILWAKDKGLEAMKNFTDVRVAIDDDPKNIEMYHRAGIRVAQVAPPNGTDTLIKARRSFMELLRTPAKEAGARLEPGAYDLL